ncbi:MAG: sulfotransferase [Methyloprofundus sp.]|nr:sulfotransferase [Methyloprofundus sp.]
MKQTLFTRAAHRLTRHYEKATAANRALPNFIIIGAQKAGTSSLHRHLAQHPQLIASCIKEVHFFDGGLDPAVDNFKQGPLWYRSHFPLQKKLKAQQKTFESSPLYLFNPDVAERIHQLIPDIKIIVLLRDPSQRAISHYFKEQRRGKESLAIFEAMLAEEQRIEPIVQQRDFKNEKYRHYSYKSRGLYREQLERYYSHFAREQILVINSEYFLSSIERSLMQVFEFVGVDATFKVPDLQPRNVGINRVKVAPEVTEYLNRYFSPHNQALYDLVSKDFGWP